MLPLAGGCSQTLVVGLGLLPITVAIKRVRPHSIPLTFFPLCPAPSRHTPHRFAAALSVCDLCGLPRRSARSLARLSTVGLSFALVFTGCVVITAIAQAVVDNVEAAPPAPLELWRPSGALVALPVMAFAFSAHALVFPLYSSLRQPTPRRMGTVARRSLLACASIYGVIGVCGYRRARERAFRDRCCAASDDWSDYLSDDWFAPAGPSATAPPATCSATSAAAAGGGPSGGAA